MQANKYITNLLEEVIGVQLAQIEINTLEDGTSEVIVNGVHLEKYLAGFSYQHKAGEVPVLHIDLFAEVAKVKAQNVAALTPILIADLSER